MLDEFFRRRRVRRRIQHNILSGPLSALADHMRQRGHPVGVIQGYVQAAEHFGHWLARSGRTAHDVNEGTIDTFLVQHLPRCRCRAPRSRSVPTLRAALRQLACVVDTPRVDAPPTQIDAIAAAFDTHLQAACGLAASTRHGYVGNVRKLLALRFKDGAVDVRALKLADIASFISRPGKRLSPASVNGIVNALRSFGRYLQFIGAGDVPHLSAAPRAAHWRLASLPQVLTDAELATFLAAFDRTTAVGRRGYALALCFSELGLRAGEAASVTLGDIDWRTGLLSLAPGKARQATQLPLPAGVAAAIADYVQHGRPVTSSRVLFVHHRAPRGQPLGATGVRVAIRYGFATAGFGARFTGTHVLRHTAATRMLRAGVSLKEIADVLRHRSLDTSAIYAKVDTAALAAVAMPWPGVPT